MDRNQIVAFLGTLGVHPSATIYSDSGWVRCPCPLAPWTHDSGKDSNPSFAIKVEEGGRSTFNCFTCKSGYLSGLLWYLQSYGAKPPKYWLADAYALLHMEEEGGITPKVKDWGEKDEEEIVNPWPESFLESFIPVIKSARALEYLKVREIDIKMALALEIVYDPTKDTVCFPVRDWHGKLCGLRGRHIDKEAAGKPYHMYKYAGGYNSLVWLGEHRADLEKPVLLVESVFDYASVLRVYQNVLAPLTVGMSQTKVLRLKTAVEIVTMFDCGAGGDKARKKIADCLPKTMLNQIEPPDPYKDPGEMPFEDLVKVLKTRLPLG